MLNVHPVVYGSNLWISYKRCPIDSDTPQSGTYFHCTCQNATHHGTVDIRHDAKHRYFNHHCHFETSLTIPEFIHRSRIERHEDMMRRKEGDDRQIVSLIDEVYHHWIIFQNSLNLSFRGAVSKPLLKFADCLIKLGQSNPSVNSLHLLKPLTRKQFSERHGKLSEATHQGTLKSLAGKCVCAQFDGTKIGSTQFLITFLTTGGTDPPVFYSLVPDISTQEQYAKFAANMCIELAEKGITVVSFCTDGLKHQVNAISELDNNDSMFVAILTFSFLFFFFWKCRYKGFWDTVFNPLADLDVDLYRSFEGETEEMEREREKEVPQKNSFCTIFSFFSLQSFKILQFRKKTSY
jgi:hypothetical protein